MNLIHGDSLLLLPTLPAKSFDIVCTDPPYGIGYVSARRTRESRFSPIAGDDDGVDCYGELHRILKHDSWAVVFCNRKTVRNEEAKAVRGGFVVKNVLVWWKRNGGMGDLKHTLKEDYELALLLAKGNPTVNHRRGSVFDFEIDNKENHPTAKPVRLMKAILEAIGKPGYRVLDPFMGIGSTGIACGLLDMDFMGVELEERYYEIAKERILGTASDGIQLTLF